MNDIYTVLPEYYKHKIAVIGKLHFFIQIRDALVECIRQLGFEVNGYSEIKEALVEKPTCIVVIQPILYPIPQDKSIIWIMIQTEQLFIDDRIIKQEFLLKNQKEIKSYLSAYDIVLEFDRSNIDGLRRITNAVVAYFPLYWYPPLEKYRETIPVLSDKEYDLLFIGSMPGVDDRRKKLLKFLSERYKVFPETTLWNEEKYNAIAKSKICLNIHNDESRHMEIMRLCDFFAYEGFVLSEPMHYSTPFVEGQDYVEFFWTNLCEKIDYYLAHDEERNRIVKNAYNKLHQYTLMDSAKILIDNLLLVSYNKMREREEANAPKELKNKRKRFIRMKRAIKKVLKS